MSLSLFRKHYFPIISNKTFQTCRKDRRLLETFYCSRKYFRLVFSVLGILTLESRRQIFFKSHEIKKSRKIVFVYFRSILDSKSSLIRFKLSPLTNNLILVKNGPKVGHMRKVGHVTKVG